MRFNSWNPLFLHRIIPLTVLVLLFLPIACTEPPKKQEDNVQRDKQGFEVDPPGQWYHGDLHVHSTGASNDTGGDSFPKAIAEKAKKMGLHFVVLTDHSNSTGSDPTTRDEDPKLFNQGPEFPTWAQAATLSIPGTFLMVSGNEISPVAEGDPAKKPTGHIGCIPKDLKTFDRDAAFVDRPKGKVTGGQALEQALKRGCFAILNHPFGPVRWISYDWTSRKYNGMEVWNGGIGFDAYDRKAMQAWKCDLLKGRKVTPVAASDNHRVNIAPPGKGLDPALGWPTTSVWATKLEWPALMKGLQAGHVALHEGDSFLQIDGYDKNKRRQEKQDIHWIRIRGKLDKRVASASLKLKLATSCKGEYDVSNNATLLEEVLHSVDIQAGKSFDIAVKVAGRAGLVTAELIPSKGSHYHAFSRGIRLP